MNENPYQASEVTVPPSDAPAAKTRPSALRAVLGTAIVLALSMSLSALITFGHILTGLEISKVINPAAAFFAVGLTLAFAWPRHWAAAGCAPMLFCLVFTTIYDYRHPDNNGTGIMFAGFVAFTLMSLVGAAIGLRLRNWSDLRRSRKVAT